MKKGYLILSIAFCVLFCPKNAFAFSGQFHVNSMAVYKDDQITNATANFNTWNSSGNQYWVIPSNSSDISALHINVDNYFSYEVPFDVSFQLVWSGYNYDDVAGGGTNLGTDKDSIEFKKPIVQFAGVTCDVHTQGLVFNNGSIMNVKCEKVSTNDSKPTISAWFSTIDASNYGISKSFNWYQSSNITKGDMDEIVQSQKDTQDAINNQTEEIKNQTETLKDKDTSEASSSASGFFSGFENNDFGLTDVITAPLDFIKNLSSATCTPLKLKVPFLPGNNNLELPCMTTIYKQNFNELLVIYQSLTLGIISYFILLDILRMVNGFKNPDRDEIEVVDL